MQFVYAQQLFIILFFFSISESDEEYSRGADFRRQNNSYYGPTSGNGYKENYYTGKQTHFVTVATREIK